MKKTSLVLCIVSAALLLATPALAATTVRLVDQAGAPRTDCDLIAYRADGSVLAKMGPSATGAYTLMANAGDKLSFDVGGPSTGWHFGIDKVVPMGVGPQGVTIVLAAAVPTNDLCENAIPVAAGGSASGSTTEATLDTNAPTCVFTVTAPGVWHTVEGTGTELTLSLANSNYDTKLHAYCGDCASLTCIGGDDDGGPGLTSQLTICGEPGVTYNVLVSGFGSATGNYELTVTDTGVACTPDVSCVPTGACCNCLNPPNNCSEMSEADCLAQGSAYQGDNTTCLAVGADLPAYVALPNLPIIDVGTISDTITVTDDVAIGDIDVDLILSHTWVSDLNITLTGPNNTVVPLWVNACGSNDGIDAIFDDEGNVAVCGFPTTGVIDPESVFGGDLGLFEGTLSAGNWTLTVQDEVGGDVGVLAQWSLHIAPGESVCPDPPVCGNAVLEEGEDCDDGNLVDGDGCSAICRNECATAGSDEDEDSDENGDGGWWGPGH
jgi:cysteine-rich repeat protein